MSRYDEAFQASAQLDERRDYTDVAYFLFGVLTGACLLWCIALITLVAVAVT